MKAKGFFRQNCLANYDYPMPFAVRSIGCTTMRAGEADIISGAIRHPSLEISWTISGSGEIIHYGQPFEMRRNDVFLFLPDETHHYRVKSREWHWRWLCIDGPCAETIMLAFRYSRIQTAECCSPAAFPGKSPATQDSRKLCFDGLRRISAPIPPACLRNFPAQPGRSSPG